MMILPLLIVLAVAGCKSTGTPAPEASASPENRCEKLKRESFYNTDTGRSVANATCKGVFVTMSNTESTQWVHREVVRQRSCKARTGKLCED